MHILDTVESGLTDQLKNLSLGKLGRVFGIVCKIASGLIRDLEPEFDQIVGACNHGRELASSQIDAARLSAKWADERYFDLKHRGVDESVWLNWFLKARFATAVYAASCGDSWENFADALYELSVLFDDASKFATIVTNGIKTVRQVT